MKTLEFTKESAVTQTQDAPIAELPVLLDTDVILSLELSSDIQFSVQQ